MDITKCLKQTVLTASAIVYKLLFSFLGKFETVCYLS